MDVKLCDGIFGTIDADDVKLIGSELQRRAVVIEQLLELREPPTLEKKLLQCLSQTELKTLTP